MVEPINNWLNVKDIVPASCGEVFIRMRGGEIHMSRYHGKQEGWHMRYDPWVTHWMPKEWFDL